MGTVPSPRTWHIDDDVADADFNQEIRDVADWILDPPRILLTKTSNQTLTSGVFESITWQSQEEIVDMTHSTVSDSWRINVNTSGMYFVVANLEIEDSGDTDGQRRIDLGKNGAQNDLDGSMKFSSESIAPPGANINSMLSVKGYQRAVAGDWFQLFALQGSGELEPVLAGATFGAIWVER